MKQELKNDLIAAWNEAEELKTSLTTLSDSEIINVKDSLIQRADYILHWLGKYVYENDIIQPI